MPSASIVIVSPAPPGANNGNAHTASRWRDFLSADHPVRIVQHWSAVEGADDAAMLALHARRSADSIAAWHAARGARGLCVVLTGTDLYQDLPAGNADTRASLTRASRLVVLQEMAIQALPAAVRDRARVIFQSTEAMPVLPKATDSLQVVMCGHLRAVKDPGTLWRAAALLAGRTDIRIDHIGDAGEPEWAEGVREAERRAPGYHWLGGLPHEQTRRAIQQAHVLVHTSLAEGGAHVIMEAARSGTPVLASKVDGNVGMLGEDYRGYFPAGDAAALAALLLRCREGQLRDAGGHDRLSRAPAAAEDPDESLLTRLARQCARRAPLFSPEAERAALLRLTAELLAP